MKPADRKPLPTVAETVTRAVVIADPDSVDEAVTEFDASFEDDDRPATSVEDLAGKLHAVRRSIDPEEDSAALATTVASAVWLSTNMHQADDRERVLREAGRLA